MEGSHSVSSGPAHQDDSWTCQRCGWVYPNAHPSAKHRRNHKKQCGKVKGFELRSNPHKGGSSDEASSGDDGPAQKGSTAPAVEHPNVPQSRDLLVTELNVPDKAPLHTPSLQDISTSVDVKSEFTDHESTRDVISIDTIKTDSCAPEPESNIVSLDKSPETSEEGKVMYTTVVDRVEEPAHISPGLYTDEAEEFLKKDVKYEDPPIDLTTNKALMTLEEHTKPHAPQVDRMEAAVRDLPGLDFDQANSAENDGAKSEGFPPKHTESIASLEDTSKTLQDESKVSLTPCVDKVEMAAHESQGLDSDHAEAKGSLLISEEQGLKRQGVSQGEDSWTCRHCGWVYPNPHPSAKHRKKHKKQCGKIKGFELHTERHNEGSSDEVSSDEDVHVKKEHVPHQPPEAQERANEMVATESLPSTVECPPISVEGEIITESVSNSLQLKEFSAEVDAPAGELQGTSNVKDISTPDMIPSVVPELHQNVPLLDQQNLPAGDDKKDLDQVMKVSCASDEPDTSSTKESLKHLSMKEVTLPNPAFVQENFGSLETQLNVVPSAPRSVDTLASEGGGDLGKETHSEHGPTTKIAEEPSGISGEWAPDVASIPSVLDLKSSDASPPPYFEDKDDSMLQVNEPSAVVIPAMDPRGVGLSNETLDVSAGEGLNKSAILKEETDVSEKPGLSGLDPASNLDALDDTMVKDPLRKEMGETLNGGSDSELKPDNISSDLSSSTLPADKVPVENKSVTENLLPPAALSTAGSENDANEEGKRLSVQTSVNPVQLVPKDELLAQIVEGGGNDDAFSSTIDKTDGAPPVTNMEHLLDNQTASVGVAKVDVPEEVIIPAVTTGEAISIQKKLDEFLPKNVSSVSEDSGQGETRGDTENTNTTICIAKDTGVADIAKESESRGISEGIPSEKDDEQKKTEVSGALEAMAKPEAKEETPLETGGIGSSDSSDSKEETPLEKGGIGSSDSSYAETYSFTRSESGVTARSELEASSHKLSDSLEIFEDAQDSLETCSVGGSVEENESLDEPRQASDGLQEESKHLGAASLDEMAPGESVVVAVEPKPSASNGSRLGEASLEEKAPSLPGTSYGGRNEMEDLKAPSPEAWQEPGPSIVKSEGKKISTSEVTEDSKSGESHTALRSLMAKEGPHKGDPLVETSTVAGDLESSNRKDGSLASANGAKPKSKSFWRHCICCSTVH